MVNGLCDLDCCKRVCVCQGPGHALSLCASPGLSRSVGALLCVWVRSRVCKVLLSSHASLLGFRLLVPCTVARALRAPTITYSGGDAALSSLPVFAS